MRIYKYLFFILAALLTCFDSQAQTILPNIRSDIGTAGAQNIEKAERLFCYRVEKQPANYSGYTIDNLAVKAFCGVIDENLRGMLFEQLFTTQSNFDFINTENCSISPRILLRFVRGVDNTDVLLSVPCHSISIFYGGKLVTYNMKPAEELMETIINAFKSNETAFVSPALLNQLMPIGVAQTAQQKAQLGANSQPKRDWETNADKQPAAEQKGWNSLDFEQ